MPACPTCPRGERESVEGVVVEDGGWRVERDERSDKLKGRIKLGF